MRGLQIVSFVAAVLVLLGILLFGGLLLFPKHGPGKKELLDVSIEEEAKPDKPEEEEKPKELEVEKQAPPEKAPELKEEPAPLDLAQLELALNPGLGDGTGGDFLSRAPAMLSGHATAATEAVAEQIFSLTDLDQPPRVLVQPAPEYPAALRKQKLDGTVYVLFMVDRTGRVDNPIVQKSTNPAFEPAALQAVKRWKFESGKRNGQAVVFRMRVPITFKGR